MKKTLFFLAFLPLISYSQTINFKQNRIEKELRAAYNNAQKLNNINLDKTLKLVLDSALFEDFYQNPDEYVPFYKFAFIYDQTGKNTSSYTWILDFQDDTLGKTFYTYNSSNQLISSISYSNWDGWEYDSKKTFLYTGGLLSKIIDSTYNSTDEIFELYMTLDYTYDTNNKITEIFATLADVGTTNYGDQKIIFDYNTDGTLKKETILFENTIDLLFYETRIYEFDYLGSNNKITHKQRYDNQSQTMVADGKSEQFYDLSNNKSDLILPISQVYQSVFQIIPEELIGSYTNKLDSLHELDVNQELTGRMRYFYNQKNITGLKGLSQSKIEIYPNPTKGEINFKNLSVNSSVQILDICGKLVLEFTNLNSDKIDLFSLSNGIYTMVIEDKTNATFHTKKIVLNK